MAEAVAPVDLRDDLPERFSAEQFRVALVEGGFPPYVQVTAGQLTQLGVLFPGRHLYRGFWHIRLTPHTIAMTSMAATTSEQKGAGDGS